MLTFARKYFSLSYSQEVYDLIRLPKTELPHQFDIISFVAFDFSMFTAFSILFFDSAVCFTSDSACDNFFCRNISYAIISNTADWHRYLYAKFCPPISVRFSSGGSSMPAICEIVLDNCFQKFSELLNHDKICVYWAAPCHKAFIKLSTFNSIRGLLKILKFSRLKCETKKRCNHINPIKQKPPIKNKNNAKYIPVDQIARPINIMQKCIYKTWFLGTLWPKGSFICWLLHTVNITTLDICALFGCKYINKKSRLQKEIIL